MHHAISQLEPLSSPSIADFAADIRRGLALVPKRLPPKYLHDDLGSSLFGAICHLPWYRIARAEKALLVEHRATIAAAAGERAFRSSAIA